MKGFSKSILIFILSAAFFFNNGFYNPIFAYVMQSGNYRIESDSSLSPTGGLGSSVNYIFQDTMGQVSSGGSESTLYKIKAGFQDMQQVSLSVSSPGDVTLAPNIPGVSGGTADANTNWTVQTDASAGFDMKINASTNPAMKLPLDGTYYFDDYPATPTFGWNIGSNAAKFGFNVVPATPADAVLAFKDNGASCGSGSGVGNCWAGLNGTTLVAIIHRATRTDANGENESLDFKAQSNKLLKDGDYSASITITVVSN